MKYEDKPEVQHMDESRKQKSQSLRAEKLFRALFSSSPIGIYIVQDRKFKLVNPRFRKITGYCEEELLGTDSFKFVIKEDRRKLRGNAVNMLKGERFPPYEYRFIKKDGEIIWIMETVASIQYKGRPAILGNFMDITEQKHAEDGLRESEERYRMVIKQSVEAIYMFDPETRHVMEANNTFLNLLGYSAKEVQELLIYDFIANDRRSIDAYIQHILNYGAITVGDRLWRRKDGNLIDVHVTASKIMQKGKEIIFVIARDITEYKKAEEERKKGNQRLLNVFQETIEAIALTIEKRYSYLSGHQQRVSRLSVAIANELGLSKKEIEGIRIAGIIHDIGKISVPAGILSKPGPISEIEFSLIKTHPKIGYDILKNIEFPWPIAEIIYQHHEKIDGSGYPSGLSGKDMLTEAKIISVADIVEAIASHRPYRPALGIDAALEEISGNKGVLYDKEVVNACLELFKEKGFKFE